MHELLRNYELTRLGVAQPGLANAVIWGCLLLVCLLSVRRAAPAPLLDRLQTDQLRGIAILCVVVGHLWVHVSAERPAVYLGAEAVALFLLLSGYGLTRSSRKAPLTLKHYLSRRVRRVLVPYWGATLLIVILDGLLLGRSYPATDLGLTVLGINLDETTQHMDFVRWYITYLLFWYVAFFAAYRWRGGWTAVLILAAVSLVLFPADYYVTRLGWYQFFAFPAGCALAHEQERLSEVVRRHRAATLWLSVLAIALYAAYRFQLGPVLLSLLPTIACIFLRECMTLALWLGVIGLLALAGDRGLYSRFLAWTGKISYELFLLHGVFLIKYDPFLRHAGTAAVAGEFLAYLAAVMLLSQLYRKAIARIA